jgi:hypothetical protein
LSVGCGTRQCAAAPAFLRLRSTIGPVHFGCFGASRGKLGAPNVCAASALMSRH